MLKTLEVILEISGKSLDYDRDGLGVDDYDENHAIRTAFFSSIKDPYILLELDGKGVSFDSQNKIMSTFINSDFEPSIVEGVDHKIYMDRICASMRSGRYDSDNLRNFFNRIEFYCFIICKYKKFNGDAFYKPDSDTQNDRIKIMQSIGVISSDDRSVLREIANIRNMFAHTLTKIDQLTFRDEEFKKVLNGSSRDLHTTLSTTMKKIIDEYDKFSKNQVDWCDFFITFNAIINYISSVKKSTTI